MRAQRGFTLLEMLAALVILALCSTVLLVSFGQAARALQQVQRSDRLVAAARSVLDEETSGPLQPGQRQGQWAGGIRWQLDIREVPGGNRQARLLRLDLSLREHGREANFSTLRLLGPAKGGRP